MAVTLPSSVYTFAGAAAFLAGGFVASLYLRSKVVRLIRLTWASTLEVTAKNANTVCVTANQTLDSRVAQMAQAGPSDVFLIMDFDRTSKDAFES